MLFNATFNNSSFISCVWSVLAEELGVPEKTTDKVTDKLYHIMSHREARESLHIGKCKIIQYYIDF